MIAWSAKVSPEFLKIAEGICQNLVIPTSWLMACMAFESGRTFSPSIRNAAGSGAIGLIQFMPSTAMALDTNTDLLAAMTAEQQLEYVAQYFDPLWGKLKSLEDVYMAILWPSAVGKPMNYVLFDSSDVNHPKRYIQNAGLDLDKDGKITKKEAASRVSRMLDEGLLPENVNEENEP